MIDSVLHLFTLVRQAMRADTGTLPPAAGTVRWAPDRVVPRTVPTPFMSLVAVGLSGILLSACGTSPRPPMQALQAAELAIGLAEQASVADEASRHLSRARVGLAAARSAEQKQQMTLALQLADRSLVDARMAIADLEVVTAQASHDPTKQSAQAPRSAKTAQATAPWVSRLVPPIVPSSRRSDDRSDGVLVAATGATAGSPRTGAWK